MQSTTVVDRRKQEERMHDPVYALTQLAHKRRARSYTTQDDRLGMLHLIGTQLVALGYPHLRLANFKGRHIHRLVKHWQAQGLSDGTLANRLSCLRWVTEQLGCPWIMSKHNSSYGVAPRPQVATVSKARTLDETKLARITDPWVKMSLELQREYGLRKEEALKIQVAKADQ